ncbi:hypothetical protein CERZMDRAFT_90631 [Cercospora zeae-maydis SCOH1-5]|uniref:RRM domain-containing protein n=1 Tax=Cercospora zeae-maydis SCOH1-5 TaxID=717836 RepID=A0A6A6FGT5_9PEZI|nr:hypothetical protein CERZMDRAFT_90631 [Cercospora zeae-maydis SCOH1-5]
MVNKKSTLDKIRASAARVRASRTVVNKDSAWHRFDQQNVREHVERATANKNPPRATKRKAAAGEAEKPNKASKTHPESDIAMCRASVANVASNEFREASDPGREVSPEEPDFPASWTPAGGHFFGVKGTTPTKSLRIARIPGWRVEKFARAVGELLLEQEIEDHIRVRVKAAENEGIERSTDIFVEFEDAERAEEVKKMIHGKILDGRRLTLFFGEQ